MFTPVVIRICRRYHALDKPGKRKVHSRGIPRLGGVAIFISCTLGMTLATLGVMWDLYEIPVDQTRLIPLVFAGLCGFFFIGFLDDLKPLPAMGRLAAQFVVALMVVLASGGGISIGSILGQFLLPEWLSVLLTVVWIVGVVNTFNWIDGLDGLTAGIALISATAFLVLAIVKPGLPNADLTVTLCILLIGSILGFLRFNFHPAKIFIGDGGAFSLGYLLAVISVIGLFKQAAVIGFFLPLVILALPITDTAFAIIRRLVRGQPVLKADDRHIHHRMLALLSSSYRSRLSGDEAGMLEEELVTSRAHRNAVLALYAFAAVFAGIAVLVGLNT